MNVLFSSDVWNRALESYARAAHLTVRLFDADGRPLGQPVHPTPLFLLFAEMIGFDPGFFADCAFRCLTQSIEHRAVILSEVCGFSVVGTSLVLDGKIRGAAVAGYVFVD